MDLELRNKENTGADCSLLKEDRSARAFRCKSEERRYWALLITLTVLGILASYGLLVYNNPVPVGSPSFIPVVRRRMVALVAMIIATVCQSLSTVAFQSITNNRVITPSLLGFEALYSTIHTRNSLKFCRYCKIEGCRKIVNKNGKNLIKKFFLLFL